MGMGANGGPPLDPVTPRFPEYPKAGPPTRVENRKVKGKNPKDFEMGPVRKREWSRDKETWMNDVTDPDVNKVFYKKRYTTKEADIMARRKEAYKSLDEDGFDPMFPPEDRFPVDPSTYPPTQKTIDVTQPKKLNTKATIAAKDPEVWDRLQRAYDEGAPHAGAHDWYHMGQMEKAFIDRLGPVQGKLRFDEWASNMAATTAGMDPITNARIAHYATYTNRMGLPAVPATIKDRGRTVAASHQIPAGVGGGKHSGGGALLTHEKMLGPQGPHADGTGIDPFANPKRYNFRKNFLGHDDAPTLDEQMGGIFQYPEISSGKIHYGPFEEGLVKKASEMGISPVNLQEVGWAGQKRFKDVADGKAPYDPKPMIDSMNRIIAANSKIHGISQKQALEGMIDGTLPMFGVAGAAALPVLQEMKARMEQEELGEGKQPSLLTY